MVSTQKIMFAKPTLQNAFLKNIFYASYIFSIHVYYLDVRFRVQHCSVGSNLLLSSYNGCPSAALRAAPTSSASLHIPLKVQYLLRHRFGSSVFSLNTHASFPKHTQLRGRPHITVLTPVAYMQFCNDAEWRYFNDSLLSAIAHRYMITQAPSAWI